MSKILTVEDDESLREVLARSLALRGHQVLEASDGEQALEITFSQGPQLVLLDLLLPKLDGFGYLKTLRGYHDILIAQTPVVVLSNLWTNKDILRAESLNIDEYFVKSNTRLEDVYQRIEDVLRTKAVRGINT